MFLGSDGIILRVGVIEFAFLFKLLFVPFEVFNHQIFPGQLIVVSVVVHFLVCLEVKMVQYLVDRVSFHPEQVPVLTSE